MPHGMMDPVVFRRNRWKKFPWAFLWERSNVEKASLIIFNTDAEKEKALRSGWGLRETFILPHLIDLNSWKTLPPRSTFDTSFPEVTGCEVVLFVGRINWVKNLDKLVEALAIVRQKKPSAMLVCVGPDSDGHRAKLEQRARELGCQDHILFPGMLEGEQLKAAYARADVFALVSRKENFGLVVAEALASGLPVVISKGVDVGKNWVSEDPIRRVTPIPVEIAGALIDLLERSKKRGLPDLEARAVAEKEWSESKISDLIEAYRSILSRKEQWRPNY
jgi:glycosyltransferase involved in cell wall biosynthesis